MDAIDAVETLVSANKPTGLDCPRCARPDGAPASNLQFLRNGGITWETAGNRLTADFL